MATQQLDEARAEAFAERMLDPLDGEGLGTAWGEQKAKELPAEADFDRVEVRQVDGHIFNNYYVASTS